MNIKWILCLFFPILLFSQVFIEQGRFGGKGSENGKFNNPQAIAISKGKVLYVVDTGNHRIQLFDLSGEFIKSIGGFGFNDDQFDGPRDIWVDSIIDIYVADYNNRRVQRYDRNMNFLNSFYSNEGEEVEYQFAEVSSCVVTSQNDFFILDHDEYKVIKFKRDGSAERSFGRFESGHNELQYPEQMELWGADKLLVSDSGRKSLFVYDLFGTFIRKIGSNVFEHPQGIEVDNQKNIYVADPLAKKVFRVNNTLDNISEISFPAMFKTPRDIAVISSANGISLYVIDGNEIVVGLLQDKKQ